MSALLLFLAASSSSGSPFEGHWACRSAFEDENYELELSVVGEQSTATISNSNNAALPDGTIRLLGAPERVQKYGPDLNNLSPELRWDGQVTNPQGWRSFSLRWDDQTGLFVSMWQYFADRSPSRFAGELLCEEISA